MLLHGVLLRSLFIRGTSVTGSAAPMSRPSVRPDAGKLTRRSPPSRRSSDDDPLSGDDFSWNRSTRMLDIGHRRTSVDYLPEKRCDNILFLVMMMMGRGGAMPSNISSPRYLPVLVVSLCVVCTCARLLCGIPCRGFSAAHALIKNKTLSCETHTDQASQHHQGRGTNGK